MLIQFPWFFRKRNPGPEFYRMTCAKCDFDKKYELAKDCAVVRNPENDAPEMIEIVEELPKVCPHCGAKLKKEKLPVKICY